MYSYLHMGNLLVFLTGFCYLVSSSQTDVFESSEDSIIKKAFETENVRNTSNSLRRYRRELSLQKIRNHQGCGKVRVKSKYGDKHTSTSYLENLMTPTGLDRKVAFEGEFPWMAALIVKKQGQVFHCGGSLIDHLHVLTAASCVARMDSDDISRLKVILGAHDIYNPYEGGRVEASVSQVAFHKEFYPIHMENNIAVIKLTKPVSFSYLIQPICLPNGTNTHDFGVTSDKLGTVSGWGQMLFDPLKFLSKLDVLIWDNKSCGNRYSENQVMEYFPRIRQDNLCAGSPVSPNKNLCQGNNGAPLVIKRQRRYELIGITSWGAGADSYPCVFTRVDKFIPWIRRNIA